MKLPRNLNADELIKLLLKFDYSPTRQSGSHIRLTRTANNTQHHITIPNHKPIRVGTLNSILKDISEHLKIEKEKLITTLFG